MASKPANEKLWNMVVAQAKAKYSNYPNPGASHWVHEQYIQHGGRFIETTERDRRKGLEIKKANNKKKQEAATNKKEGKNKPSKKDKGKK